MTDEERKKLCEDLRYWKYPPYMAEACIKAADEIERLAKENGRLTQALIDKLAAVGRERDAARSGK